MNRCAGLHGCVSQRPAAGFALVELLIALIVCCLGLLGLGIVAARQTALWRSMEHEQAAQSYLLQMADDLRVSLATESAMRDGALTPEQQLRLLQWQIEISRHLPEGQGAVVWHQASAAAGVPVEVRWLDTSRGEAGTLRTIRLLVTP